MLLCYIIGRVDNSDGFVKPGQVAPNLYRATILPAQTNPISRDGKIGPIRWANPVRLKLGLTGTLNYWPEKNRAKFGPVRYGPARPGPPEFIFALKRLFGPIGPVFKTDWAVKILIRKNRTNFSSVRF